MQTSPSPAVLPSLTDLRVQIDALDAQLLSLLNQRAHVAEQVGEIKRREGSPFFRPDRVAQVIQKIQTANQGPLKDVHVADIWREIMSACLALEAPQRVAVLGPAGTFCEQAALQYFGGAVEMIYCSSFDEVFHSTEAGRSQFGVTRLFWVRLTLRFTPSPSGALVAGVPVALRNGPDPVVLDSAIFS